MAPTVGPRQAKRSLRTYARCTNLDSSRACAKSHLGICSPLIHSLLCSMILVADSKGSDQKVWMRMLMRAFVSAYARRQVFAWFCPFSLLFTDYFFQIDELKMYMNIKRLRDLKLDDKGSIGYTFKCMGAGFWALKKDDFRTALQKIVLAVKFKLLTKCSFWDVWYLVFNLSL